ncbi:alpha/beta fold hydrolase [Allorhizocola rhizosphaerae]|uniref:alpha/beta fold hydrolase n=1 Tax=Allorhizocola rhizosphaerae TaxID=1872709 RepID=UPI0013C30D16|nr:alpha/beta hydrolase [Allorhizocola rhizosphaerae]
MRVEVSRGVWLNVLTADGAGQAFVLVHGLSSNARLWGEVAAALSRAGHPSYSIDLRSHGESSTVDTGHDTVTAAADVATVIRELLLDRPVVAGQSWGGNVVVRLAAKQPELVGAIGLVDGGWIDLREAFDGWESCERILRPANMDSVTETTLRQWMGRSHPDWSPAAVEAAVANFRVRADGTLERRLSIDNHMRILRSMWDDPPSPDLPLVTVPALLMPAQAAGSERGRRIETAARQMPSATIVWYEGGDHDLHAQQPERVAADLLKLARAS